MKEVNRFPAKAGDLGWFETSTYKNHIFTDISSLQPDYDFVVVGGGYAGVNCAFRLAENRPGAKIALFEALPIGMGDSGRNAGFLIDVPHSFGEPGVSIDDHRWRTRLNKIVIERMRKIKDDHKLTCDWMDSGKYLAAREPQFVKNLKGMAGVLDSINEPYRMMEKDDLPAVTGTEYYIKALYTYGTVLLNPADVVRALATALPENVDVFEETPVLRVQEGGPATVRLVNGKSVRAGQVFLLASVFVDQFGIEKKGRMTPVNSFGAFTRELTEDELAGFKGVEPWGCTSGHAAGTTVRFTKTKRIFVRNGFTYATHLCTSPQRIHYARKKLRKAFEARFPQLKHVNFEYVYGGMIPMTLNGQSLFAGVARNVYAGSVGDGCGLTRSAQLGMYLADMACNVDSEELRYMIKTSNPGWCPPEPFKMVGATVRLAYEEFRAQGEI